MTTTNLEKVAALIGDLIGSRRIVSRIEVQKRLEATLDRVNTRFRPLQALRFTIGDEFQGVFTDLKDAIKASVWIRLETESLVGVRMGIGWGDLTVIDADRDPMLQDGSSWWRAREAIGEVTKDERRNSTPQSTRALVRTGGPNEGTINAGMILLDALLARFDSTDATMAMMGLDHHTQEEMAARLGMNKSSISRRMQRHGVAALVSAYRSLGGDS